MAHLMRSFTLLQGLDLKKFEILLAAGVVSEAVKLELEKRCTILPLKTSVSSEVFLKHISQGSLPYDEKTVQNQVSEDLEILNRINPDVIVGDFRHSLQISSQLKKIPYINVTNITWHPRAKVEHNVPDLKIVRLVGESISLMVSKILQPLIYRKLVNPFQRVAKKRGLVSIKSLLDLYVSGDYAFHADLEGIVDVPYLEENQILAGPILGSIDMTSIAIPEFDASRPRVVISLGSSGPQALLPLIVSVLEQFPVNLYVATSGMKTNLKNGPNLFVTDFLPLKSLLASAQILICNGGSATGYMALAHGVPFIGIPSNLDQFNFTGVICKRGAALRLRIEQVSATLLKLNFLKMLNTQSFSEAAKKLQSEIAISGDSTEKFCALIDFLTHNVRAESRSIK